MTQQKIRDLKKGKIEVNLKMVVRKKMTLPERYRSLSSLEHVCAIALEHKKRRCQ
ncbi:hypothetical protein [Raoultella sp. T31]|uniref:hypothetical protein n=1 Tax=Raoultella sp. T31 TaxID=2054594 RepID=UPI0013FD5DC0